jgi:hypothetical protein
VAVADDSPASLASSRLWPDLDAVARATAGHWQALREARDAAGPMRSPAIQAALAQSWWLTSGPAEGPGERVRGRLLFSEPGHREVLDSVCAGWMPPDEVGLEGLGPGQVETDPSHKRRLW